MQPDKLEVGGMKCRHVPMRQHGDFLHRQRRCISCGFAAFHTAGTAVFRAPKVQFIEPRKAGRLLR